MGRPLPKLRPLRRPALAAGVVLTMLGIGYQSGFARMSEPSPPNADRAEVRHEGLTDADLAYLRARYPDFPVDLALAMEKARCGDGDTELAENPYSIPGYDSPVRAMARP